MSSAILALVGAVVVLVAIALRRRSSAGINTSRLGRFARVTLGSAHMVGRLVRRKIVRLFQGKARREAHDRQFQEETSRLAVETMGDMKGVFMKLGQIVSFMDEILPEAAQKQLRTLQSQAPPMDYEVVAQVIHDELGHEPEVLFADLHDEALAAASIGQVHKGLLHDGTEVVVKVQYPGVDAAIAADLKNVGLLMNTIGALTPTLDAKPLAEELRDRVLEELDYVLEAEHQERFAGIFAENEDIIIPGVVRDRSAKRVLTTEFVDGIDFYEFVAKAEAPAKRRAVLAIRKFVFDSIWRHNLFNGDPHPGNYRFHLDGRVAFLDYGCVKQFDPTFIDNFRALNRAYLEEDRDGYYDKAREMGFIIRGQESKVDKDWLWGFTRWFYEPILVDEPFAIDEEYCRKSVSQIFGDNVRKVNMPPEYLMLNRITFGFNSIMAKLGARENWRQLSLPYYYDS